MIVAPLSIDDTFFLETRPNQGFGQSVYLQTHPQTRRPFES